MRVFGALPLATPTSMLVWVISGGGAPSCIKKYHPRKNNGSLKVVDNIEVGGAGVGVGPIVVLGWYFFSQKPEYIF